MRAKKASETSMTMAIQMMPYDANPAGNIHGGVIMRHIDTAAGVVALRHAGSNVVTASLDRLDFHHPVMVGNVLILKASINLVGTTSMEVGVRVEAENPITGTTVHTASAYLTMVSLDKQGKPIPVNPLEVETPEEMRRLEQAKARRALRLAEKKRERGELCG